MNRKPYFTNKVFLIFFIVASTFFTQVHAQCTPDLSITSPGIIPDSATNFSPAIVGVSYSQIIQIKAPADSVIIVGGFPVTATIVSIELSSLTGMPPGLSSACVPSNCTFPGGSNGCAVITGTPTTAGLFNITAVVTANVTIFGAPNTQIDTIDYYFIDVSTSSSINEIGANSELILSQNVPNPVTDHTQITYYSSKNRILTLTVHDLLGSKIYSKEMEAQIGQNVSMLNLSGVSPGIYLYSIGNDEVKATKRLVIAKE